MITNRIGGFKLTGDDLMAVALTKLHDHRIDDHSLLIRHGYKLLVALRLLAGASEPTPDNHLNFLGAALVNYGFAVPVEGQRFTSYCITAEGRRFIADKPTSVEALLPGWIKLVNGGNGVMNFDLRNIEHVQLMCRFLPLGWHPAADKRPTPGVLDTEEYPAVRE
jgi:hypothetical protein